MSHFSNALSATLARSGLSQTEFAAAAGMAVGQLNRYAKGRSDLRPGALNRLLETAGPEEEASLLRAYLLDQCPDDKRHLVEVAVVAATANEDRPDPLAGLPLEVREALRFLGSRCHERPVMDLILNLARLLRRE